MKHDSCIHYTGALNPAAGPACKQGINYRELVGGDPVGWVTRLPCSAVMEPRNGAKVSCDKHQLPTPEEIAEDERRTAESVRKFMVAYTGKVREWREANKWDRKNPKSAAGKVPCEVCSTGEIHLLMHEYNGHVHGKCSTEGCVSWME
jgi:hypothetical protein